MAVSPHEEKMVNLQHQMRQNQTDLQEFIADLGNWEDEMKTKEQDLKKKKTDGPEKMPPVRNSLVKKKLKKKKKKKPEQGKPKKISGFDFKAWDKFDVDKALQEIDGEEKKSSSEYETDEEWEMERKKHLANEEKNTGNSHLSAGAYEVAVECYSRGIELDPTNALLPANRALALIKMEKYGAAEVDCTSAIALDPLYVKAYLRRAAARVGLQRLEPALEDYNRVLQLEPGNVQAQKETERLRKEIQREKDGPRPEASSLEKISTSEVKAVYKPPEQRSKKPLRRIEIEEIGIKENTERKAAIAKVEAQQSSVKKEIEAKDRQIFEKFTGKASGDTNKSRDSKLNGDAESQVFASTENGSQTYSHNSHTCEKDVAGSKDSKLDNSIVPPVKTVAQANKKKDSKGSQKETSTPKPISPRGGVVAHPLEREPPQTSFQFQGDFKVLKNDLQAFYAYFKRIDPALYPKLFGQSLEAPILLKIMDCLQECCIPANEDCFDRLKSLSEVKRFSMIVMFLSSKEKQGIKEIFQYLRGKSAHQEGEIDALMKKYEV
ncbi:RNA polymerase II-associated protein 3-like [Littorina saxatilis]|uniref:RNA polymerase II-associated protein 3 n=1 Tax=Littorina saxatilis TaxID=31220 RepID=A0AAN9BA49_9CAEN